MPADMDSALLYPAFELDEPLAVGNRFSRIYPIEPRGLGTGSIECLTSYISQLARAHSMLTSVFTRSVLLPAAPSRMRVRHKVLNCHLYTADGYGLMAERLVHALAHLLGHGRAEWLTALAWREVFSRTGSTLHAGSYRRWCPLCWKEDALSGRPVYGRLSWTIGSVAVCVHHEIPLEDKCPNCNRTQLVLPGLPILDLCGYCGSNLRRQRTRRVKAKAHDKELWIARAVDKLIQRTCASQILLGGNALNSKLAEYIDRYADGKPHIFAKAINFGIEQMRLWRARKTRPGFALFMELCYRLDCPPDRFLLDSMELLSPDSWRRKLIYPRYVVRVGYTAKQIARMETHLGRIVDRNPTPPPRITDIARRLGVRYCFLRWRFPIHYRTLMRRSEAWRSKQTKMKVTGRSKRLKRAYYTLLSKGEYPSQRRLKSRGYLSPSELRLPAIRAELAKLHRQTEFRVLQRISAKRRNDRRSKRR